MASIERTAYPRFKRALTRHELHTLYTPTADEHIFIAQHTQTDSLRLSMLVLLKTFQHLGYFPQLDNVPAAVVDHVRRALHLPTSVPIGYDHARTLYRHHATIRSYLKVMAYGKPARHVAVLAVYQAAQVMNHPADLINVALAELIRQRYELPAFSTLDHLVQCIRTFVNRRIFQQVQANLSPDEHQVLEQLLTVKLPQRRSDFSRLKDPPPRATLTHLAEWQRRLTWLLALGEVDQHLAGIPSTKVKHFAAEARALDADGLRDMTPPKRMTLLLCLIHQARVTTRDQLVMMFLKRMSTIHTRGKDELQALRERQRATTEQLLSVFTEVLHTTEGESNDAMVGRHIRALLHDYGGVDVLLHDCEAIAAYNGNNYLPLLWKFYRSHRSTLFRMVRALDIRVTTQDQSLLTALEYLLTHEHTRKEHIPALVSLEFASEQWQRTVLMRKRKPHMFHRRHFEVCVLSYLAHELKTGDLCVPGSEAYADYREQLLSWEECVPLVPAYCQELGVPTTAHDFVTQLQTWLVATAERVDRAYPANDQLVINDQGEPTLKRLLRKDPPAGLAELEAAIAERMPERSVLDILCSVQHWTAWTRHFGPPSGVDPKIEQAVEKYIITTFGYGCNLGPAQTARHTRGCFPDHSLTHVHHHHISTPKLEAALRDVINGYNRLGLPKLWGTGRTAAAHGTKYDLREQTLLAEYSIRYGGSGGIAYHHVSDMYIALFSHFIACGVWEAIYIIDGLLRNQSELQPDTVHADTQGQNAPVFGLTHLLGIKLMPRMRNWKDLIFYRPSKDAQYRHIDALFRDVIDWKLLETHWQDLLRVVLSIQAGTVLPSTLLRKLTNYSRKNKLYQAFRELGRVVRTVFLLEYIADPQLRTQITAATNKVEAFNGFSAWLFFGGEGMITDSAPEEQEKRIKYKEVIANAVILQNVVDMTQVLHALSEEEVGISREMVAALSPYLTRNIKRFGDYTLDMTIPPQPFQGDLPLLR